MACIIIFSEQTCDIMDAVLLAFVHHMAGDFSKGFIPTNYFDYLNVQLYNNYS